MVRKEAYLYLRSKKVAEALCTVYYFLFQRQSLLVTL